MRVSIGIDVGGTDIKGGVVSEGGDVLARALCPTLVAEGVERITSRIDGLVRQMIQQVGPGGMRAVPVGLGVPGLIMYREGRIVHSPNLPCMNGVPIADLIAEATGRVVVLENDANAAAMGEYVGGVGRGTSSMVMLTIGTGIGSGLILDGKIWRGAHDNAGELGHMIVQLDGRPCGCGQHGCLEAYAAASAIARHVTERLHAGEPSVLSTALKDGDEITARMVSEAAQAGDSLAVSIWEQACRYLGLACLNINRAFNPDCIVLAGGMSSAGEFLVEPIRRAMGELNAGGFGTPPEVRIARLGNDAGFIGAAINALRHE